ncbi:signal transduction histidine kinase [Pseudonocardia autotrophica]|uniref:histidine kinase n=2 Tax=Pseudonocardia TaxID=1847 RepID=A0A1Y2MI67_PSEAH|nr:Oxygen sensor histidine kinase NreB [Pseudonocardia autotrophica]TDN72560.1 signal transduction histidine kinase [Pseudonocardia autotrophica]BBG03268.1 two-component sensor histidine kinase [Pseudonocardia autotrophica]GEC24526.1 two-component sensor histidine kinase [Pseudonocardia saturnea]
MCGAARWGRAVTAAERPTIVERFVTLCRRNPVVVDAVLAALLMYVAVSWTLEGKVPRADQAVALVMAVLVATPVALRRTHPIPAAVGTAVIAAAAQLFFPGIGAVVLLPALVMGYSAIAYGPRWAGAVAFVLILLGAVIRPAIGLLTTTADLPGPWALPLVLGVPLVLALLVWLSGSLRRAAVRRTEQLRDRARLLEETRRQEVRIELLAERSRISREVHDVVAHSLSGIIAQADGGQFAAQRDPQKAVEVLAGIATTGREALGDVRGLLEMLRDSGIDDGGVDEPGRPQPGTDDVAALVEQVRAGGLPVELAVTGTPRPIGGGSALTAYRVVQEALTNVLKHAGPATPTHVGLEWTEDELTVRIRDEGARGPVPRPPRGGHGLIGMRERAALHGGSVETGPHPDGGWAVRLRLPLRGER